MNLENNILKSKLKVMVVFVLSGVVVVSLLTFVFGQIFYVNYSSSAPKGLYLATFNQAPVYGSFFVVEMPRTVGSVAEGALLLKKLRGMPGDKYMVNDNGLQIGATLFPVIQNAALPRLSSGNYVVPDDFYLFLNDPFDSFDGRYFGPVPKSRVCKRVLLVLSFDRFYDFGRWFHEKVW